KRSNCLFVSSILGEFCNCSFAELTFLLKGTYCCKNGCVIAGRSLYDNFIDDFCEDAPDLCLSLRFCLRQQTILHDVASLNKKLQKSPRRYGGAHPPLFAQHAILFRPPHQRSERIV